MSCRAGSHPYPLTTMPHEFKGLSDLPHDALGTILAAGVAFGIVVAAALIYLGWRHRKPDDNRNPQRRASRGRTRRKRRANHAPP